MKILLGMKVHLLYFHHLCLSWLQKKTIKTLQQNFLVLFLKYILRNGKQEALHEVACMHFNSWKTITMQLNNPPVTLQAGIDR